MFDKPDRIQALKESEIDEDDHHNVKDDSLYEVTDFEDLTNELRSKDLDPNLSDLELMLKELKENGGDLSQVGIEYSEEIGDPESGFY